MTSRWRCRVCQGPFNLQICATTSFTMPQWSSIAQASASFNSIMRKGAMPFPPTGALVSPSHCPSSSAVVSKHPFFQSNSVVSWPPMLEIGKWQNRAKLSKTKYFDSLDVVNWPPTHSEFSLGRPVFGCGNWWKLSHEFEKYVAGFAITWFKLVA